MASRDRKNVPSRRRKVVVRDLEKCPHPEKHTFSSKADAKRKIARMRRRVRASTLHAYRCACGVWHIGHTSR